MRNKFCFLSIILGLLILIPVSAKADEDWVINTFDSQITLQRDGKVNIVETIDVNFNDLEKHGIYRDIPYVYQSPSGEKIYTIIEVIGVGDENLNIPYEVSSNRSNVRIKIGDPKKTVSGQQRYKINYLASGVLTAYDSFDELYWNATGLEWPVPIKKALATVLLPEGGIVRSACYIGGLGSSKTCSDEKTDNRTVKFDSRGSLDPGEGLTIAVGFNKGMVAILKVDAPETISGKLFSANGLISFFISLVISINLILRLWWKRGRDIWERTGKALPIGAYEPIGAEYESPEKLRPAEIGVIMDERADTLDVSATIVDLAVRGYLTITEEEKKWRFGKVDYILTKTNKKAAKLLAYEKKLLSSLFEDGKVVKLSELKNTFFKKLAKVKKELYKGITQKGLFTGNPETTRKKYIGYASLVVIAGVVLLILGGKTLNSIILGVGLGILVSGIALIFIGYFSMPQRTALGREIFRKARGYKLFVSGTEKYRQPFFENENTFMDVLPYAIVFGVTKKLATAMKQMGIKPPQPTWYAGIHAFNASVFASNIDSFSKSLSTSIASSPSGSGSGGGGFSGGGFGGGGGGSW